MKKIPLRLAILQRLSEHLEALTPANGYSCDLAGRVIRGRIVIGTEEAAGSKLPLLSILESPRPELALFTAEWGSMRSEHWTLLLQGLVRDDLRNPTDPAYVLAAEVEEHLARIIDVRAETGNPRYPNEHLLGGLITSLDIAPPVVRPPEHGVAATAFFYLPVRVGIAGKVGQPYVGL